MKIQNDIGSVMKRGQKLLEKLQGRAANADVDSLRDELAQVADTLTSLFSQSKKQQEIAAAQVFLGQVDGVTQAFIDQTTAVPSSVVSLWESAQLAVQAASVATARMGIEALAERQPEGTGIDALVKAVEQSLAAESSRPSSGRYIRKGMELAEHPKDVGDWVTHYVELAIRGGDGNPKSREEAIKLVALNVRYAVEYDFVVKGTGNFWERAVQDLERELPKNA